MLSSLVARTGLARGLQEKPLQLSISRLLATTEKKESSAVDGAPGRKKVLRVVASETLATSVMTELRRSEGRVEVARRCVGFHNVSNLLES